MNECAIYSNVAESAVNIWRDLKYVYLFGIFPRDRDEAHDTIRRNHI